MGFFLCASKIGRVWYPLKANSSKEMINQIEQDANHQIGYLVSGIHHFNILQEMNIDTSRIGMINVLAPCKVYNELLSKGVSFYIIDDFKILKQFVEQNNSNICIGIRLSLSSIFKEHITHLGVTREECKEMIAYLKSQKCNYGLTIYIEDNYKDKRYQKIIFDYILANFREVPFLSIGGITSDFEVLKYLKGTYKGEINLEIGDELIKDKRNCDTEIIRKKIVNDSVTITINKGIYTGFFDVLLKNREFVMKIKDRPNCVLCNKKTKDRDILVEVFGGSGNADDHIGKFYTNEETLFHLTDGNILTIQNTGSYFDELTTKYGYELEKGESYEI